MILGNAARSGRRNRQASAALAIHSGRLIGWIKRQELKGFSMRHASVVKRPNRVTRLFQKYGAYDGRNMFWSWVDPVNFGDWVGPFIYEARVGKPPIFRRLPAGSGGDCLFTVGSVMAHIQRPDAAVVWGSGIIARDDAFARPKRIHAVRGPLTRGRCLDLGYDCPEVFGDPAILLPEYLELPGVEKKHDLGVIPHFRNYDEAVRLYKDRPEVLVIDVRGFVPEVVSEILSCKATVSSSLHGQIVSHAYGIPSAWVKFTIPLKGDDVKFLDYYLAGGVSDPVAVRLSGGETTADLVNLAKSAPMPENDALKPRLSEACPF